MATSTSRRRPATAKPLIPPALVQDEPIDAPVAPTADPPPTPTRLAEAVAELAPEPPSDDLLSGALAVAESQAGEAAPLAAAQNARPAAAETASRLPWSLPPALDSGAWLQSVQQWRTLQEQAFTHALDAGREAARQLQSARDTGEIVRIQSEWLRAEVEVALQYWRDMAAFPLGKTASALT
jgi:hypothetical protein